ncbi:MAG: molybdate ABC transporter permease subunit [Sandaracinaceae bacterium]
MTRARMIGVAPGALLLALLVLPFVALLLASGPAGLWEGAQHPLFVPALWLSARTSLLSLSVVVFTGTPLAWWMATSPTRAVRLVERLVELPVVVPPAVVGIALLSLFGRQGLLGPALDAVGVRLAFTTSAVVLAQVVVSAPFYVQSAAAAFRRVGPETLLAARTLGATPWVAFSRVAVPIARPGMMSGVGLSFARAIGEFGATLLFAGSLEGVTQTMPLAIFQALEVDVRVAVALSLLLAAAALLALRLMQLGREESR